MHYKYTRMCVTPQSTMSAVSICVPCGVLRLFTHPVHPLVREGAALAVGEADRAAHPGQRRSTALDGHVHLAWGEEPAGPVLASPGHSPEQSGQTACGDKPCGIKSQGAPDFCWGTSLTFE